MARARNIKPSLFKNEILGVADPYLTILFEGLWCLADRAGRLEDRPLRIKAEIFPYREGLDVNGYLTELERLEFIHRYVEAGIACIQVVNFAKHQAPHKTEKPSELPEYTGFKPTLLQGSDALTVKQPLKDGKKTEPLPPDSLIPDSLNTDSLIPDGALKRARQFPPDFAPNENNKSVSKEMGADINRELIAFADFHKSKGSTYKDWNLAFNTWLRNSVKFGGKAGKPDFMTTPGINEKYGEI